MKYYDLHIVYNENFGGIINALCNFGYTGVFVSFRPLETEVIKEARKTAKDLGLDFFSRYNIIASKIEEFNKQVSRFDGHFDYLAIDRVSPKVLMKANLKKISIINLNTAGFSTVKRLYSQGNKKVIEFCIKSFSTLTRSNYNSAQRMIRSASFFDRAAIPLVITSGAEHPLDVKSPLQLLYTFLGLIGKKQVNKKYILNPFL